MTRRGHITALTMKASLILGFCLTFGIWLFAGSYFMKRISDLEARTASVSARYTQAQELLSTVRAQTLLASVYVRDALLDPEPVVADYRRNVEDAHQAATKALRQYVPVLDAAGERERVERLQREMEGFFAAMLGVIAGEPSRWRAEARTLLNTEVVPKRRVVIDMSDEVQVLNRNAYVRQQREVAEIYAVNQRTLWVSLGLALAASVAVGLLVALHAGKLEKTLRAKQESEAANARELQRLSARLITAQEEERRAIARELHDEVGQVLTAIRVELAVAKRSIESEGGSTRVLDDVRSITEGALTTVRDLSHLLHPALLDDLGLKAAVEWYLRGFGPRYDIRTELVHDGMDERLAPAVEASAYRIVQEALTNVAKHARATICKVSLQRVGDMIALVIEDDGVGFDQAELAQGDKRQGLGLISIRERALQLRGTVRIETGAGRGTRLTVELPAHGRPQTAESVPGVVANDEASNPAR